MSQPRLKQPPRTGLVHTTFPTAAQRNGEHYKTTGELASLTGMKESELVSLLESEKLTGVRLPEGWLVRLSALQSYLKVLKSQTKRVVAPRRGRRVVQNAYLGVRSR